MPAPDTTSSSCPGDDGKGALSLLDLIQPGLEILFVGINPGMKSARVGHYYAGPGNLFWRCLYESGLTPVLLRPDEDRRALEWGIGITDCVKRASRMASEVRQDEFRQARPELLRKIEECRPRIVCFNGLMGYRSAIDPTASLGLQPEPLVGAAAFVVPSTSAANAGFTRVERVDWFRRLRTLRDELRGAAAGFPG
jgi:TDG/mug DNA glycosylase family protein